MGRNVARHMPSDVDVVTRAEEDEEDVEDADKVRSLMVRSRTG